MKSYEEDHLGDIDKNFGQMVNDNSMEMTLIPKKVYAITFTLVILGFVFFVICCTFLGLHEWDLAMAFGIMSGV